MEQVNHAQAIDQESKKEEAKIETRKKMLELEKLTNQEELNKLDKMKQMGWILPRCWLQNVEIQINPTGLNLEESKI